MSGQMFPCQLRRGTSERRSKESNLQAFTWPGLPSQLHATVYVPPEEGKRIELSGVHLARGSNPIRHHVATFHVAPN